MSTQERKCDGLEQYHEPPGELPSETRTFARLCASLTEEAEAIGWYEQRLAVEADPEAQAIMRDAQGEEFKHFSMDTSARQDAGDLSAAGGGRRRAAARERDQRTLRVGARTRRVHVAETAEHGGYPLFDHLHKILGGPIVWAPGVPPVSGRELQLRGRDERGGGSSRSSVEKE